MSGSSSKADFSDGADDIEMSISGYRAWVGIPGFRLRTEGLSIPFAAARRRHGTISAAVQPDLQAARNDRFFGNFADVASRRKGQSIYVPTAGFPANAAETLSS